MPEIDQYRVSELDTAISLNNNDLMEISQENQSSESGYSSAKATLAALATKIANNTLFPTELKTATATLIGAINSVLENLADEFSTSSTYAVGDCVIYGGRIYQCNTAIVTPGAWDSTKWSEVKATDVGSGGGGGGGGGHTIVDGQGTSLAQRSMLQFLGAYSEDDSAADTTKVDIVREMTKAEFDLLSADEKTGFINITDITGGNDDRFQPVIYSEEEREIGVWLDGKPLYQKTLVIAGTSLTAGRSNTINHGISNVDYIQLVNGTYTFGDGGDKLPLPFADNYKPVTESAVVIEAINSSAIRIGVGSNYSGSVSPNTVWVTVQYTKTTDTAGSGQWTPQGVPAVHYSEDEHIVGTWIDGSTLYEKTIVKTINCDTEVTVISSTDIPNIDTIVSKSGFLGSIPLDSYETADYRSYSYINSNSEVSCYCKWGNSATVTATITVRYTKSST